MTIVIPFYLWTITVRSKIASVADRHQSEDEEQEMKTAEGCWFWDKILNSKGSFKENYGKTLPLNNICLGLQNPLTYFGKKWLNCKSGQLTASSWVIIHQARGQRYKEETSVLNQHWLKGKETKHTVYNSAIAPTAASLKRKGKTSRHKYVTLYQSGKSQYIRTSLTSRNHCSQWKWRPFFKNPGQSRIPLSCVSYEHTSGTFS